MQFRIAAYGEVRDHRGRLLLTRRRHAKGSHGPWHLPGGIINHGESPAEAAGRLVSHEVGTDLNALEPVAALAIARNDVHTNAVVFRMDTPAAEPPSRPGTTVAWVDPQQALAETHSPFVSAALGETDTRLAGQIHKSEAQEVRPTPPSKARKGRRKRGQRFGAYGVVSDADGRILLAQISEGYPGGGTWHLPGGGVDFAEAPAQAVVREIWEETGQNAQVDRLLGVTSFRHRRAIGPEGYPLDWHGVRAIYGASVSDPSRAQVVEAAGGSTCQSRWFQADELRELPISPAVEDALGILDHSSPLKQHLTA
ncbi:NUDIX hydrolase [Haloglycomyces albus]|uniref:NUDIX hydrolase n=1 Tax=Haloglycomyces albus TaxID=526067 RepID=UPI00046C93B6|nr:NUDIX hydrolase [Haloglycomyces albus]